MVPLIPKNPNSKAKYNRPRNVEKRAKRAVVSMLKQPMPKVHNIMAVSKSMRKFIENSNSMRAISKNVINRLRLSPTYHAGRIINNVKMMEILQSFDFTMSKQPQEHLDFWEGWGFPNPS
ncbi:hypothetical protein SLE2022_041790 [Rubroshorea leprosula]